MAWRAGAEPVGRPWALRVAETPDLPEIAGSVREGLDAASPRVVVAGRAGRFTVGPFVDVTGRLPTALRVLAFEAEELGDRWMPRPVLPV
jgi:hypothetical protein